MKKSRDISVTYMRVIFTLWILFFHSFNEFLPTPNKTFPIHNIVEFEFIGGLTKCVLIGFVFISGLLMARGFFDGKYSDTRAFIIDKCKRLLIPYCFWCVPLMIFYNVSWIQVLDGAKHLWFLMMLFEVMVIAILAMPYIRRTCWQTDIFLTLLIIVISALSHKYVSAPYVFGWVRTLTYLPAFLIGIFVVKYRLDERLITASSAKFYSTATVVFICAAIVTFAKSLPFGLFYMDIPFLLTPPYIYLFIRRLGNMASSPRKLVSSLDRNSLGIYILHQFIGKYTLLYYVPGYVTFYDGHPLIAPTLLFIEMLFISWATSELLHKTDVGSIVLGSSTKRKI